MVILKVVGEIALLYLIAYSETSAAAQAVSNLLTIIQLVQQLVQEEAEHLDETKVEAVMERAVLLK
jgi:hypothetical protein